MGETRQTTIRFGEEIYRRLELAGDVTGLPINSIVIVACMEWLQQHRPDIAYRRLLPPREAGQVLDQQAETGAMLQAPTGDDTPRAVIAAAVREALAQVKTDQ